MKRPFSGRSLDERVVNPFLRDKQIPSSRGPYLSVFRRSVAFDATTRRGVRDKPGYGALLQLLEYLGGEEDEIKLRTFLRYLLYRFAEHRESAAIPLAHLQQISLEQYDQLISSLLATRSGGRFPVLLVVAALSTIKDTFGLSWTITWQGINVADAATGAGGDLTVSDGERTVFAAEITERALDRSRVVATFNTKIAPAGIEDYLFFVTGSEVSPEASLQARQYFVQGHDVNFLNIKQWILMILATVGRPGRTVFNAQLRALLEAVGIPKSMKVAWNEGIAALTGSLYSASVDVG